MEGAGVDVLAGDGADVTCVVVVAVVVVVDVVGVVGGPVVTLSLAGMLP